MQSSSKDLGKSSPSAQRFDTKSVEVKNSINFEESRNSARSYGRDIEPDRDSLYRLIVSGRISLTSLMQALVVAEHRNFRRASERLGVSQSSVSARISSLEEVIGFRIFNRPGKFSVTQQGQPFLFSINEAVSLIGKALNSTQTRGNEDHITVGVQSSSAGGFLCDLLNQFVTNHPTVHLLSDEFESRSLLGHLRRCEIDIAFTPEVPSVRALAHDIIQVRPLWSETVAVALSDHDPLARHHELTWEMLFGRVFLVRTDGIGSWLMAFIRPYLEKHNIVPRVEYAHVGRDTLLADVVRLRAVAFTTDATSAVNVPGICIKYLQGQPITVVFYALWSRHNHNPALRSLLQIMRVTEKPDFSATT